MSVDALSTSSALAPLWDRDPQLFALAQAYDAVAQLRRRCSEVAAFLDDFGHYLPVMQRRRLVREVTAMYDELIQLRRTVLGPLDVALGE